MPTSEKQIEANRQNAQKSTGPKSASGKAISSRNNVKHGLYSKDAVLTSFRLTENQSEYDHLFNALMEELDPQTVFQRCLVKKIADCLWRSRRAVLAETAHLARRLRDVDQRLELNNRIHAEMLARYPEDESTPAPAENPEDALSNLVDSNLLPQGSFSTDLLRYEMRLDRQMTRAFQLLHLLKRTRIPDGTPKLENDPAPKLKSEHSNPFPGEPL